MKHLAIIVCLFLTFSCKTSETLRIQKDVLFTSLYYSCPWDHVDNNEYLTNKAITNYIKINFEKQLAASIINKLTESNKNTTGNQNDINYFLTAYIVPNDCMINLNISVLNSDSIIRGIDSAFYSTYKNYYKFLQIRIDEPLSFDCYELDGRPYTYFPKDYNLNKSNTKLKDVLNEVTEISYLIAIRVNCNYPYSNENIFQEADDFSFLRLSPELGNYNNSVKNLFAMWFLFKDRLGDEKGYEKLLEDKLLSTHLQPFIYFISYSKYLPTTVEFNKQKGDRFYFKFYSEKYSKYINVIFDVRTAEIKYLN